MPIYEYICADCELTFEHFWPSIRAAAGENAPACPGCGSRATRRIVSQVAVLGSIGGLTPGEQAAAGAHEERLAKITPKEQIAKLRAGKK
ncbi:MAG: FmdB family zinc ribbon protein [Anaerolineae bacterium]